MLSERLKDYRIILGSSSPRRQEFLKQLGIPFDIRPSEVDEIYPPELKGSEISDYLACLKANGLKDTLSKNEILITSDTVVWHKDTYLGKPENEKQAFLMLRSMSGDWHKVITSVCFTYHKDQKLVRSSTEVKFSYLTDDEIWYYIKESKPFDKAGGYGIQDWIGLIGIEEIKGSYTNVVGLPTQLVYKTLTEMASQEFLSSFDRK